MSTFAAVLTNVSSLVTESVSWLTTTVGAITGNALLSFWALLGLCGVGIGLYHRLAR